jgi:hypothetical protein
LRNRYSSIRFSSPSSITKERNGFTLAILAIITLIGYNGYMANMVRARIQISGKRPLLQHQFGPEALPLEKGEPEGVAGNNPQEWRKTCMVMPDGQLYIRGTYVFSAVREGAKHTKKGKGSIQGLMAATLQVEEDRILLDRWMPKKGDPTTDATQAVYIDVCGVRNPATKARNVRYRLAASTGWKATFTLLWDKTIVSREQMRAVLNDAGTLVGLADGRSVGYGRFAVESFEVLDAEAKAAA